MQKNEPPPNRVSRPTPEEIASIVRGMREAKGWKQLSLADEAKVNVKTIERIEAGKRVNEESLDRVAQALGFAPGAFIEPFVRPTPEEIDGYMPATLHEFSDARDFAKILDAHAYLIDTGGLRFEDADDGAALTDQVRDWGDIHNDLPAVNKLEAYRQLYDQIQQLRQRGYLAKWACYRSEDNFEVALIAFKAADSLDPDRAEGFRIAAVPKRLQEALWERR
jgi:transcriptional regulator with XRE-family HTH domain